MVTKTHQVALISSVIAAGAVHLGENYVEEAQEKIAALAGFSDVQWHMIGHIQSRKTSQVAAIFDCVHGIDRVKIARRLASALEGTGKTLPLLLECNVSGEASKFGWQAWDPAEWPSLAGEIAQISDLPNIQVQGLMTMAPYSRDPEQARPYFKRLRELARFLGKRLPHMNFEQLSMGMSGDYPVAIEEGATILRIGTAIMGQRDQ